MEDLKKIFHIVIVILLLNTVVRAHANFYVSPKGNDSNRGTLTNPFKSITRALSEARKTPGTVVVYLLKGTYYLNQPIIFIPSDSRKDNETLTITNFENQKVSISGSAALNLKWQKYKDGIWQARVGRDLIFDELIVNGKMQRMARYPNYDSTTHFLRGTASDIISKKTYCPMEFARRRLCTCTTPLLMG